MSIRMVLVDDHQLVREGLRALIQTQPDFEVVGEAPDARAAYDAIETARPDLVLMDVTLPGVSGISATRELKRRNAETRVLLLTMHDAEDFVVDGLAAGALGFALKHQPVEQIFEAIRAVARGQAYLCSKVSRGLVEQHLRLRRGESATDGPTGILSTREREVFDLLIGGLSNREIAKQLFISRKTVETHRAHILRKLHVHSVVELVRLAARHNLIAD